MLLQGIYMLQFSSNRRGCKDEGYMHTEVAARGLLTKLTHIYATVKTKQQDMSDPVLHTLIV